MISYFIVLILEVIVGVILSPLLLLPNVTLPDNIATSLAQVVAWLWIVMTTIPYTLAALFAALVVVVGIETKIFSYKAIKWIYNKIPGVN